MTDLLRGTLPPPSPRPIGAVNWRGLWSLYVREVRRFYKVGTQTLAAPVVTTLLFFVIFNIALGGDARAVGDLSRQGVVQGQKRLDQLLLIPLRQRPELVPA